jgi:glutamate N-acetyltransferase/amino-acid N-acetyltransferase
MVAPNMATMLAFIFTDAKIQNHLLKSLLFVENRESFNSITIDGDTSTNDSVIFFSTGKANKHSSIIRVSDKLLSDFRLKFQEVMTDLATQIVSDGEGASKLIFIKVIGAVTKKSAKSVGLEIANSPLVKTAFAGEDPNWGRIVMAIGKSNEPVNINKLKIKIGDQLVTKRGSLNPAYEEEKAKKYLKNKKIKILIDLGVGSRESTITTCDLTKKYIDINTDYRS